MYVDGYRSSPDMVMCFKRIGERGQRVFARQNEKVEKKSKPNKTACRRPRKENTMLRIDKRIYARFDCFMRGLENNAPSCRRRR